MAAYEYWRVQVQFTAGTWTEVTSDVDTLTSPIRATNGATPETTGEPASLSLVLHNPGFRYTPGNTSSPTALATGMPIRFFEVISDQTIYHFTGFVEFPEIGSVNLSMTQTQTLSVTAVDQLSAWERSSTFVSTLGAHILYAGGTRLKMYWPCLEDSNEFANVMRSDNLPKIAASSSSSTSVRPTDGVTSIVPQGADPVLADDANPVLLTAASAVVGGLTTIAAPNDYRSGGGFVFSVAAGQVITSIGWYRPEMNFGTTAAPMDRSNVDLLQVIDSQTSIQVTTTGTAGTLQLNATGTLTSTINGPTMPDGAWFPLAIRYGWDSALIELWVGSNRYTGVLAGVPAGPNFLNSQQIVCTFYAGAFAHVQTYVSSATDFSYTDYLAQYQVAQTALARQTTGERIETLAKYGGKNDGQLINVDTGCTVMQPARLAGRTVADAMYEARDTEQGDLYVDGSGLLTFHDRRTILNI